MFSVARPVVHHELRQGISIGNGHYRELSSEPARMLAGIGDRSGTITRG